MRKTRYQIKSLWPFFLFLIASLWGHAQHRLVLLHPTVSNIENMEWMVENKIIDIPDVQLLGVYYAKEAYDYSASVKYVADHALNNYQLCKIEGELNATDIYRENSCTEAFRKLFEESDAILFFGGPDIPAAIYAEEQHLLTVVTDPYRHYFETSFFFHLIGGSRNSNCIPFLAAKPDFIIRAFCLGLQTMNVAAGGTLIQDIPQEVYHLNTLEKVAAQPAGSRHRNYTSPLYPLDDLWGGNFHRVIFPQTGYLYEIAGKSGTRSPEVLSYHHQAVGRTGSHLNVIATSVDKRIVEGLQHDVYKNVVGVQFHPEPSALYKPEAVFKPVPGSTLFPNEFLIKTNSLMFHKLFWKDFSEKVKQNNRINKN